jgi:hypothetical protein
MFDVSGMHVLEVEVDDQQRLVLPVESNQLAWLSRLRGACGRVRPSPPCFARRAQPGAGDGAAVADQSLAVPRAGHLHGSCYRPNV